MNDQSFFSTASASYLHSLPQNIPSAVYIALGKVWTFTTAPFGLQPSATDEPLERRVLEAWLQHPEPHSHLKSALVAAITVASVHELLLVTSHSVASTAAHHGHIAALEAWFRSLRLVSLFAELRQVERAIEPTGDTAAVVRQYQHAFNLSTEASFQLAEALQQRLVPVFVRHLRDICAAADMPLDAKACQDLEDRLEVQAAWVTGCAAIQKQLEATLEAYDEGCVPAAYRQALCAHLARLRVEPRREPTSVERIFLLQAALLPWLRRQPRTVADEQGLEDVMLAIVGSIAQPLWRAQEEVDSLFRRGFEAQVAARALRQILNPTTERSLSQGPRSVPPQDTFRQLSAASLKPTLSTKVSDNTAMTHDAVPDPRLVEEPRLYHEDPQAPRAFAHGQTPLSSAFSLSQKSSDRSKDDKNRD